MQISKIVYRSESFQSTLSFSFAKIEESIRKSSYAPSRRDWELSVRHQSEDAGDILQDTTGKSKIQVLGTRREKQVHSDKII